jgi:hypothetical protein
MGFTFIANGFPILIYLSSDFCLDTLCSSTPATRMHVAERGIGDYSGSRDGLSRTNRRRRPMIGREPTHPRLRGPVLPSSCWREPDAASSPSTSALVVKATCAMRKSESPWQRAGTQARAATAWRGVAFTSSVDQAGRPFHWPTSQPASFVFPIRAGRVRPVHPPIDSAVISLLQLLP